MTQAVTEAVLNGLWQGVILTAAVWCLVRLLPDVNASTRYVVWLATLLAVICLPVLHSPQDVVRRATPGEVHNPPSAVSDSMPPTGSTTFVLPRDGDGGRFSVRLPAGHWPSFFLGAWSLISAGLLGRLAWGFRCAQRLKRRCAPADPRHHDRLEYWRAACRIRRPIRIGKSGTIHAPISLGLFDPMVLLPEMHAVDLSDDEVDQILLHELAHLGRWDDWTKLIQKLAEAIFFFHPGVRWLGQRMDFEREVACDDWVLALRDDRCSYAACLTKLIELSTEATSTPTALGAAVARNQLSRRVEMLLDKARNTTTRILLPAAAAVAVLIIAGVFLAAWLSPAIRVQAQTDPPAQSLEEQVRAVGDEVRQLEVKVRRIAEAARQAGEQQMRALEPKIRELQKQIERIQEQSRERLELDPHLHELEDQIRRLHDEKMTALEPQIHKLQDQMSKMQVETLRQLELHPHMQQLQKQIQELHDEKMRALKPALGELEKQMARLQEEKLREIELAPQLRELHRQMERLQEDSLRALQPQIRELERQIGRLQEEKMREIDPQIQELHKKLEQLREQRARELAPRLREP